jgi:hypothetical protein
MNPEISEKAKLRPAKSKLALVLQSKETMLLSEANSAG